MIEIMANVLLLRFWIDVNVFDLLEFSYLVEVGLAWGYQLKPGNEQIHNFQALGRCMYVR